MTLEPTKLIKGFHYYLEEGWVIFTSKYHLERGKCCGNKCRHCPYTPKHLKNNTEVSKDAEQKDKI